MIPTDVIDQKDIGQVNGFDITVYLVPDTDGDPRHDGCYSSAAVDAWLNDEWSYVGSVVVASRDGVELGTSSLWGSEYGWLPGAGRFVSPLDHADDPAAFVNGYGPSLIIEATAQAEETLRKLVPHDCGDPFCGGTPDWSRMRATYRYEARIDIEARGADERPIGSSEIMYKIGQALRALENEGIYLKWGRLDTPKGDWDGWRIR